MIVSQFRRNGYSFNDDRASGGQITEVDITCCSHCQCTLKMANGGIEGEWCVHCGVHVCVPCAKRTAEFGCIPFKQIIDEVLNGQARDRAYRQTLGL